MSARTSPSWEQQQRDAGDRYNAAVARRDSAALYVVKAAFLLGAPGVEFAARCAWSDAFGEDAVRRRVRSMLASVAADARAADVEGAHAWLGAATVEVASALRVARAQYDAEDVLAAHVAKIDAALSRALALVPEVPAGLVAIEHEGRLFRATLHRKGKTFAEYDVRLTERAAERVRIEHGRGRRPTHRVYLADEGRGSR